MTPRVILAGGGTAGSVTPLLAVAPRLQARGAELLFVGTDHGPEEALVDAARLPWRSIPAGKFRRYFSWRNVTDLGHIWRGYTAAKKIISDWRPDVIVSAGSYVAVPLVWAGKRRGVRIVVHQQDVQPGLANRLMQRSADIITTVFESGRKDFGHEKTRWIGNPVRESVLRGSRQIAHERFGGVEGRPTLLVLGGGTGSAFLNQLVADALPQLLPQWNVVHVTGRHRGPVVLAQPQYFPTALMTDDLPHALAIADIVVSRAGIGTLTELMATGKTSMIVPMPGTHQEYNANYIAEHQAAVVVDQRRLSVEFFIRLLDELHRDADRCRALQQHLSALHHPHAAEEMADIILRLART